MVLWASTPSRANVSSIAGGPQPRYCGRITSCRVSQEKGKETIRIKSEEGLDAEGQLQVDGQGKSL